MSNQETVQNEQEAVVEQPQEHTDEQHEVGKLIQES